MIRAIAMVLAMHPGAGWAEDAWRTLKGKEIGAALADRTVGYNNGQRQEFHADGRTRYGEGSWGNWTVRKDRYCSVWPPSDRWTCYGVQVKDDLVRFTEKGGASTTGRYVDPR